MKTRILSLLLCLATTVAAWAQTTVTGVVYEPSGETAIGATVFEKGNPSGGTSTGIDGDFSLKVSSANATIVVSYIGMETQEIALAGRSKVEIRLKDAGGVNLDEIVVVGYGTQKKINATGAVKTIDNSVLESRPLTNAVQGLQGAVAGLNITNDAGGAPGEAMNINIRGVGSIGEGSSSSPLVLIDGMEGDLATLNPNDIANISVLKDAAAASIYGSRAPFGVILVTTKGGDKATRVNYSGNVRFSKPISVPEPLDALTYALVTNEAIDNSGVGGNKFSQGVISRIRRYMAGELPYGTEPVETAGQDDWKGNLQAFGNTNWYDVHLKDHTFSQEHNVSVSGGGDKVTYYLSGNMMDQTGLFRYADEDYKRLSVSGKFNIKFNDYVSLTWTTRYINVNNDKPSAMTGLFFHNLGRINPTNPVTLPNGEYNKLSLIQSLQDGGQTVQKTNQFYNQGNLLIEPIKGWQIHADIASRLEFNPYTRQFNPISYTGPQGSQKWLNVLPGVNDAGIYSINTNGTFRVLPGAGHSYYEKAQTNIQYFSTNIYTDYTLDIARDHHFKFLAGVQTEYFKNDITRTASTNILIPDTPFLPSDKGDASTMISEAKGEWSSVGIFGRINYNYADRYMIEANLRGDAASRFPSDQRWGVFPSFSAGWNIAQENFWENLRYAGIEYLKLRGSYGVLGNQNTTSFYPYYQQMAATPGQVIIGGNQATVLPMYAPYSTSLTWEKIENVGAGIDWGLFNNRLTGAFDWYQRTTKDMVGPALALAGIYGADAPKTNNAELRTRGWEVEIAWRDRIGKDFSYGISASLSDYQTEITKYDSPDNKINGWYQGKNYGDIWGYRVVGIAKSDAEMAAYLAQHDQSALGNYWGGGDLMYANLDGDPAISPGASTLDNPGDQTVIGNTTPRYAYSFTLEAQWRWIDFRAYFQGIGKRDYYVGESTFYGFGGGQYQCTLFKEHMDYFRYADSELGANMDDPYYGRMRTDMANKQCSDRFIQDASYLRLKNLQIGFSLPENTKLKKYVRKARLYLSGENLFTITKLKIFDPEALRTSDDVNNTYDAGAGKCYPQYRTFAVGLELTF